MQARVALIALWLITGLWANAARGADLTLGVSEGTSGGLDHGRVIAKYGPLAEVLGKALGRKVQVVFAREFSALEEGLRSGRFDLAMARPSDYPARAILEHGYQFVASARPEGQCLIVVREDDPATELAQLKGRRWVLPETVSYMSKFCAAELRDRDLALKNEKVSYVREQGAVVFYLQQRFSDVGGIASYSGAARDLGKARLRVLHRSVAQPYFPLVAHGRIGADQVKAMQAELSALPQNEPGRALLKGIGIEAFDTSTGTRLKALPGWLES
ncbi:MAG: phosphate/phosphite/phosphonate ABC transporter substrate-binding protein [Piscinibacter sp.]|uniref:phosphate/phosphite/phosphonate ABC transporter substrate-binding protein n=1 Tax=Piscinibacter sp. TaxID=1903157 RepID=UPI003D11AA9D